jgi:hypothetical protein
MSHDILDELARRTDPETKMGLLTSMFLVHRALYAMAKLNLADYMQKGPVSSKDLSQLTHTDPRALYRLLRVLVAVGAVKPTPSGDFELTELGRTLATNAPNSLRSWAVFRGEPFYQQCWDEIVESIRSGKPVWEKVHGSSMFEYLSKHPEHSATFDAAMTESSKYVGPALVKYFDFSKLRTVVDVGGGNVTLLAHVLKANSNVQGILFDLPHVTQAANSYLSSEGVASRCKVIGGSFLEYVPPGGDAYVLKWIVHDWNDEDCLNILENCRKAMRPDAKLLLLERIMPSLEATDSTGGGDLIFAALDDLEMLVILGGMERTKGEYESLLNRSGFALEKVTSIGSGGLYIIEASPK